MNSPPDNSIQNGRRDIQASWSSALANLLTPLPWTKWRQFTGHKFKRNYMYEDSLMSTFCIEVYCFGCDWWEVIIGLDDDPVPNMRQRII